MSEKTKKILYWILPPIYVYGIYYLMISIGNSGIAQREIRYLLEAAIGGEFTLATSIMSSGIGPVTEEFIPYRGTKGKTMGVFWRNASYSTDDDWTISDDYMFMQNYQLLDGNMLKSPAVYNQDYSDFIDVDKSEFQEHYLGYDQGAVDAIKEEVMNGRPVCIGYHGDHSKPFEEDADNDINYISVDAEG